MLGFVRAALGWVPRDPHKRRVSQWLTKSTAYAGIPTGVRRGEIVDVDHRGRDLSFCRVMGPAPSVFCRVMGPARDGAIGT